MSRPVKRSFTLGGHRTSISLEPAFWDALKAAAAQQRVPSSNLVAQIDANAWAISIRGFNQRYSTKLLVLVDGRSVYMPSFSGVYWDQLDLIGMNSYWSFGEKSNNPNPTVDHIVDRWHEIQGDLFKFQDELIKPMIFLEIGWFSQANVAYEPWDYTQESPPVDV